MGDFLAFYLFDLGSAVVMGAWSSWLSLAIQAYYINNKLCLFVLLGNEKKKKKKCAPWKHFLAPFFLCVNCKQGEKRRQKWRKIHYDYI